VITNPPVFCKFCFEYPRRRPVNKIMNNASDSGVKWVCLFVNIAVSSVKAGKLWKPFRLLNLLSLEIQCVNFCEKTVSGSRNDMRKFKGVITTFNFTGDRHALYL
jgi:hypothetical protein